VSETARQRTWRIGETCHEFDGWPWLMGIVNVTPDSFSDGGDFAAVSDAVARARDLADAGAAVIDIGGESTRPGATSVDVAEELRRVGPVVEAVVEAVDVPVSIDTTKAAVARVAVEAGATIVNDVSGLEADPEMVETCIELEVAVICMHRQGTPATMQENPTYDDVVEDVAGYLERRLESLVAAGLMEDRIVLDPGIGFGKTAADNLALLSSIGRLQRSGRPVLVGHSRKRFLSKLLGRAVEERTAGTLGVAVALAEQGTDLIRVHDVGTTLDALVAWRAVRGGGAGSLAPRRSHHQ
jgi:dihydropteroate synthase